MTPQKLKKRVGTSFQIPQGPAPSPPVAWQNVLAQTPAFVPSPSPLARKRPSPVSAWRWEVEDLKSLLPTCCTVEEIVTELDRHRPDRETARLFFFILFFQIYIYIYVYIMISNDPKIS